jgi:hypothetical protein
MKFVHMQIARDSGKIAASYVTETVCPYCKRSKIRYDLEFQVAAIEKGQVIDSSQTIKNVCTHCLTVCEELPSMDFLCAKCGQLTLYTREDSGASEQNLFKNLFSGTGFPDFYEKMILGGLKEGKRFCLPCVYKIWQDYLQCPASLQEEIEKPKPEYELKT